MAFGFGAVKCKLSLLRRDWKKPRHEVGFRVWFTAQGAAGEKRQSQFCSEQSAGPIANE
jgi:hypothetical protein